MLLDGRADRATEGKGRCRAGVGGGPDGPTEGGRERGKSGRTRGENNIGHGEDCGSRCCGETTSMLDDGYCDGDIGSSGRCVRRAFGRRAALSPSDPGLHRVGSRGRPGLREKARARERERVKRKRLNEVSSGRNGRTM